MFPVRPLLWRLHLHQHQLGAGEAGEVDAAVAELLPEEQLGASGVALVAAVQGEAAQRALARVAKAAARLAARVVHQLGNRDKNDFWSARMVHVVFALKFPQKKHRRFGL